MRNELRRIEEEAAVVYLMALFRQDPRGTANDSRKISARTVGTGLELELAPHMQSNATSFCYLQTRYTTIYTRYVKLSIYKGPLEETDVCYGDMVGENHNGLLLLIRARTPNEREHLEDQGVDGG